ncbi:hypothetical protein DL771_002402 [Monosporascus sp. 5C6A]|nr:hypothetical protein DL771_002402 [Monosporascus sp. 5C6A]
MLSRSVSQPIRKFEPTPAPPSAGAQGVCVDCAKDVFNSSLQHSLTAGRGAVSISQSYSRLARDIYGSILTGCHWCTTIGNAVLTSSELDYWMRDWNGSRSDGDSLESTSCDGYADLNVDDSNELSPRPAAVVEGHVSFDVEDLTSSEESAEEKPGFHTIKSLDCTARLDVTIKFLKWCGSPVFNLVQVKIEANTSDQDGCSLQEMVGDNAVILRLEIMCNDPAVHASAFPQKWDVVSASALNECVTRARSWLRSCDEHVSCAPVGGFQPTRLVDVRNPNHPRLALSGGNVRGLIQPYAALSYVWGPKQEYVLTKASLIEMCVGLDPSRLPKTISDAIEVTRQLGFDYLWVDALCIIQDSPKDKTRELPLMADTYSESSLCIVVASAAAASEGFLKAPNPPRFFVEPFNVKFDSVDGRPSSLTFAYRAPYMASADPISSRAWTLQERVLSRRLLIFSQSGVMWMCRECFVNPGAAPDAGPPYQTSLGPQAETGGSRDEDDQASILERWMAIRADYTEMDLTYCADKLSAISSVAAEVQRRTGWTYLAGIWENNLFSELHWRSTKRSPSGETLLLKPQKAKEAGYLAPSWSWASVGLGSIVDSEDERVGREAFHFEILECHVDADSTFPLGPVNSGYLKVEGKTLELAWRQEDKPQWDGFDISMIDSEDISSNNTPYVVGDGALDTLDEHLDPGVKLTCLGMSKLRLGRQRIVPVEGLLLLPVGPGSSAFCRIGFFRMTAPSVFDKATTKILRIE